MAKNKKSGSLSYVSRQWGSLEKYVKGRDQFGKGIPWNMNGAGAFKTLPGGLISIVFDLIYWSYFFICMNQMLNKTTWKLTTQNVL